MSAEPPIGSFFAVSLEEIHEIAEKSGNADCILAMIALRRGQGKKKNTGWGRLSIKKHMALPHSRANYAIDWLLENRYFIEGKREVKSKGKSLGEDQSGAKGKEHLFPVRSLPDIKKWIFLPNALVDNVEGGKEGGPLGQLMRNIRTAPWSNISTGQARVDAMLVLIALYKQYQRGETRQNLVWWEWDTQTSKGKAMSLTTFDEQELCLLAATKGVLQFDPDAAKGAFGNTCPSHQILPRITLAVENLKTLGLAYTLTSVCQQKFISVGKGLKKTYEMGYVLDSDFTGSPQPLRVSALKELVRNFSEYLKNKPNAQLIPPFRSESIEFVSTSKLCYVVRSTIEPAHVPNTDDIVEISAEFNLLRKIWSNMIEYSMDNDLILH